MVLAQPMLKSPTMLHATGRPRYPTTVRQLIVTETSGELLISEHDT
jgi:hypothetical protein